MSASDLAPIPDPDPAEPVVSMEQPTPLNPRWSLVAVVALVLGGYVLLVLTGHDGEPLFRSALILLGILGLGVTNRAEFANQNRVLTKISRQTNGVLDKRIEEGVRRAVDTMRREQQEAALQARQESQGR